MAAGGSSSDEIRVMTINMGGGGTAEQRRHEVKRVIDVKKPDIILAQEIGAPTERNWGFNFNSYTYYTNDNPTNTCPGIMWKTRTFQEQTCNNIQTCLGSFGRSTRRMYPRGVEPRVCAVLLKHTDSGSRILVVSWHGPHRDVTYVNKIRIYKDLLTYVTIVARNSVQKVLIGGVFNLTYAQQTTVDSQQFRHALTKLDSIDNILCKNITMQRCQEENVNHEVLDHDHVWAAFTISAYNIRVMTINMHGPGFVRRALELGIIRTAIESVNPDIILEQDIRAPTDPTWGLNAYTQDTSMPRPGIPPVIMWKTTKFQQENMNADIQTHLESFRRNTQPIYQIDSAPADIRHRVCTALLNHIESGSQILVVSWHGPYNFDNSSAANKIRIYNHLLTYVKDLAHNRVAEVLIGGDFNLTYDEQVTAEFRHALTRPNSMNNILYKNVNMRHCQEEGVNRDVLDHDPVRADFNI